MKFSTACVVAFAAYASAAPAPKRANADCSSSVVSGHHHHKRAVVTEFQTVVITLDNSDKVVLSSTNTLLVSAPSSAHAAVVPVTLAAQPVASSTSSPVVASAASSSVVASSGASTGSSSGSSSGSLANYQAPSQVFQDGVYDCSTFPTFEGLVAVDWLGYGGWSGIQGVSSPYANSKVCTDGTYCSYLCQPGMSKTQWPSEQPASGQSLGGLQCKGGKLYRTNTNTNYLCEWGVDKAIVENTLGSEVAICRTDYPGTEEMNIATIVGAGSTSPITVVDLGSYYVWQGKPTSAQYYVNQPGVSKSDGCIWSSQSAGQGNWAPMNFGAGYTNGIAYLSLIPNPLNKATYNANIKIVADDASTVIGSCVYENGNYDGGADGCTVSVTAGRAKFVFY